MCKATFASRVPQSPRPSRVRWRRSVPAPSERLALGAAVLFLAALPYPAAMADPVDLEAMSGQYRLEALPEAMCAIGGQVLFADGQFLGRQADDGPIVTEWGLLCETHDAATICVPGQPDAETGALRIDAEALSGRRVTLEAQDGNLVTCLDGQRCSTYVPCPTDWTPIFLEVTVDAMLSAPLPAIRN